MGLEIKNAPNGQRRYCKTLRPSCPSQKYWMASWTLVSTLTAFVKDDERDHPFCLLDITNRLPGLSLQKASRYWSMLRWPVFSNRYCTINGIWLDCCLIGTGLASWGSACAANPCFLEPSPFRQPNEYGLFINWNRYRSSYRQACYKRTFLLYKNLRFFYVINDKKFRLDGK